jgi:hypothetical protein
MDLNPTKGYSTQMNIKQAAASIAAASLLAGGPALALADPNAAPVAVNAASLAPITINRAEIQLPAVNGQMGGFGLNEVYTPASVTVSFRNTSAVTATNVIFQLDENGTPDGQIADAGSFAPGATIVHQLSADPLDANEHLSVVEVKFADGSVWLKDARALRQASQQH